MKPLANIFRVAFLLVLFASCQEVDSGLEAQFEEEPSRSEKLMCSDNEAFDLFGVEGFTSVEAALMSAHAERGMGGEVLEWDWRFVGPDQQPMEASPGGSAIPSYAMNRGNGTGRINYLYVDPTVPERVFACSPTGGLFVSSDNGDSWVNGGTDQLPISGVSSIAVDPNDPERWVIATGDCDDRFMFSDGVWRTENAGKTWVNINGGRGGRSISLGEDPSQHLYISEVVAHPCDFNRIFLATDRGLFITDNALDAPSRVKWKKVAEGHFYDILVMPGNESLVFAGGGELWRSTDCGNSWARMSSPPHPEKSKYPYVRLTLLPKADGKELYVGFSCSERATQSGIGEGKLLVYEIANDRYSEIRSLRNKMDNLIPTRARALAVSPENDQLIITGNVQPLYRSVDGGHSFDRIDRNQMHDDVHHILWSHDGRRVFAAHDGGVSASDDGGLTWHASDRGIGAANVFGVAVGQSRNPNIAYGAYDTGGNVFRDSAWYHVTWGDGFEAIVDHSDQNVIYTTKQHGHIHRSTDGGVNFDRSVTSTATRTDWHTWIRQHPTRSEVIYCSGDKLVRSIDRGDHWESILDVKELDGDYLNVFRFFLSEHHPDLIYAYVLDQTKVSPILLKTMNATAEDPDDVRWERVPDIPHRGWITALVVDKEDPTQFWMAYKDASPEKKVYRCNGERYVDVTANLGWCVVGTMVMDKNSNERIYLASNHGVFTRSVQETEWILLKGLPGTWVRSLDINYVTGEIYAGTFGRGVWRAPLYTP